MSIDILGRVQGVGFRMGARHKAIALGLTGWVMNMSKGTVHIEVEGEAPQVEAFLQWCKVGTPLSQVKDVLIKPGDVQLFSHFEIQ